MPEHHAPTAPETVATADRLARLERKVNVLLVVAVIGLFWPLLSAAAGLLWWLAAAVTVLAIVAGAAWIYRAKLPSSVRTGVEEVARRGVQRASGSTSDSRVGESA